MKFETPDLTAQNIEKLAALFPGCVTEGPDGRGGLKKAVNFDLLKQMLSDAVLEGDEAYEFTWVGKKAAIVEANKPIRKTLRPCPEESKNWDTTENLYIEGDNLEVLKLLQEAYLGKVKMIYIDPPYNTGHDFIYNDRFEMDKQEYDQQIGLFDEEGNKNFVENSESNPRFHSDWCSMMYPRLMLARNMLSDNGVIFISIDDHELDNLQKICEEIFGEENFIGTFAWQSKKGGGSDNNTVVRDQEYVLCYRKAAGTETFFNRICIEAEPLDCEDEYGKYRRGRELNKWGANSRRVDRPTMFFPIPGPNGESVYPIRNDGTEGCWRWGKNNMLSAVERGDVEFVPRGNGTYIVYEKIRTSDSRLKPYRTTLENVGATSDGSKLIKSIFNDVKLFDFPKPIMLIQQLLEMGSSEESIVLDFFSGSATTAHAVMQLNAEDGGHRKFIMVQLPEPCDETSEAYKVGYKNICDIGKERIRRAGEKIKEESPLVTQNLDIGFRVLKLDTTNMEDVYYSAQEYSQQMLQNMASNIKRDRTDLDLLFGCLLDWGLPLSMPYHSEQMEGCTVHTYNEGDLIACFDENVPESVIREIARRRPLRAVFRDSSFATSPEKINVGEIFKLLAPDTRVKVI